MYSIAYIILFLLYAVLALVYRYSSEYGKTWIKATSVLVFIFFFGFRGFVGDDWLIYYPSFQSLYSDNLTNVATSMQGSDLELGFGLLQAICKFIYPDYHFFIFVCCTLQCALIYNFFRKRIDNLPLAFCIFVCMSGLEIEINLLRNSIALFICLNALDYLMVRKPLQYFCLCLLATTLHISSIVFIPLYFFLHKRLPLWLYVAIFVFSAVFLVAQINFIGPILLYAASFMGELYQDLVYSYIEGEMTAIQGFLSIGFLERLFTGCLVICYYNKLVKISKDNVMFINAFLLYFLSFAFLREFEVASRRVALLFVFSYWILWCDLFKCFVYKGNKVLYALFILCYGVLKIHSMTNEPKMQYDNILFNAKSYAERYTIYMVNKKE